MDEIQLKAFAYRLYKRRDEGKLVAYEKVSFRDHATLLGNCHDNVAARLEACPEEFAVRGWLYMRETINKPGVATFYAHTIVQRGREWIDITITEPRDPFISHVGDDNEFMELVRQNKQIIEHVYDAAQYTNFQVACWQSLFPSKGFS